MSGTSSSSTAEHDTSAVDNEELALGDSKEPSRMTDRLAVDNALTSNQGLAKIDSHAADNCLISG